MGSELYHVLRVMQAWNICPDLLTPKSNKLFIMLELELLKGRMTV